MTDAREKLDLVVRKVTSPESHAEWAGGAWMKSHCASWRDPVCPLGLWGMIVALLVSRDTPVSWQLGSSEWSCGHGICSLTGRRWIKAHSPKGEISGCWHESEFLVTHPSKGWPQLLFCSQSSSRKETQTTCLTSYTSLHLLLFHSWSTQPRGMDKSREMLGEARNNSKQNVIVSPPPPQGRIHGLLIGFICLAYLFLCLDSLLLCIPVLCGPCHLPASASWVLGL